MSQHNHMYNNHFIFSFNPESGRLLIVEKRALYYLNPQKKSMLSGFYIYFQLINYPALSKAEDKARLHSLKLSPILFKSELVLSDFSPSLLLCFTSFFFILFIALNIPIKGFVPLVILSNPFSLGKS